MAQIHNSELLQELKDGGKIQQLRDIIPNQLAEKVVPVMEVNPKLLRRCDVAVSGTRTSTGSTTLYTTPTDKDFYLTSALMEVGSDVTADNTGSYLRVVINGTNVDIIYLRKPTTVATSQALSQDFSGCPIKLDRGSTIIMNLSFTVGAASQHALITGYTVNNIRA